MALKPETIEALVTIANGKIIKYLPKSHVEISGINVHCRFAQKGTGKGDKERFPFNINRNTLTAQYELWVCGSIGHYYLIPIDIIKNIYNDPDTYVNKYPGQESIKTVNIILSDDEIKFGRNNKHIQIGKYYRAIF